MRFGPFCFDLQTLVLTKYGVTLRLEEKPARLLACLIERNGEVVSREELKKNLWGDSVYLDFDRGLNNAANKLRFALGDNAGEPRYVETLTRRGYRLIADIEPESEPHPSSELIQDLVPQSTPTVAPNLPVAGPDAHDQQHVTGTEYEIQPSSAPDLQILPTLENREAPAPVRTFGRLRRHLTLISAVALFFGVSVFAVRNIRDKAASTERTCRLSIFQSNGLHAGPETLPKNPEAARFYKQGLERLQESNAVDARALLDQSIAMAPQNALAHFALSHAYSELGQNEEARVEAQKAFDLSSPLPVETRLLLEAQLRETSFDWDRAIEIYRSLFTLSPSNRGYGLLLLHAATEAGKPAMAFETLNQLRQSDLPLCAEAQVDLAEADAAAAISDFRRQQVTSEKAAQAGRSSGLDLVVARAEMAEGEAQRALGNFQGALSSWSDAKNRFSGIGDRSAIARILIDEGRLRWQQGDLPGAEQSYNEAIALSKEIGDQVNLGRSLSGLGQMTMYRVGWSQGRKICEQALAIFRQIGNRQEEAYTLSLIADTMAWQHQKAKPLYEQSLELSREVNDRSRVAGRLMDLGIISATQGDLSTAERNIRESLGIYHAIGERNREALQMSLLAMVLQWEGRLDDAEKLAHQAVDILQAAGETNVRGQARQHLAIIQMEAGKLPEAEQNIRLAMDDARAAGDMGYLGLAMQDLAAILIAQGRVVESRSALDESDEVGSWTPQIGEGLTLRMLTRARIYTREGKFEAALREAHLACAKALRMDEGTVYMKARLVLGEIQMQSGNYASGRHELEELVRDASAKGFGLIRDQADKALRQSNLSASVQ